MRIALIGLDLGGTNIKWAIYDPIGKKPFRSGQVATIRGSNPGLIIEQLALLAKQVSGEAHSAGFQIGALGIGAPGLVDKGIVRNSPNLPGWYRGVPLERNLKKLLADQSLPLAIENDVNCMLTAECTIGAGREYSQVVGLAIGTGVGGGLWIEGRLMKGAHGGAGEIGHMTVAMNGPKCKCGNQGCLEALIGSEAIISRHISYCKIARKQEITVAQIASLARKGDKVADRTLNETGRILGVALASLANLLNPQLFIIGGGVSQAGRLILAPAIKELRCRAMAYNLNGLKVTTAKLGPLAGAIGAAILAGRELIED